MRCAPSSDVALPVTFANCRVTLIQITKSRWQILCVILRPLIGAINRFYIAQISSENFLGITGISLLCV
jgi:hypothetical protein